MFLDFLFGKKKDSDAPATAEKKRDIADEARSLLAEKAAISAEIEKIGKEKFENAILLRNEAMELLEGFDEVLERKEKAEYGAIATRIKFARKVKVTVKDLERFFAKTVSLFDSGKLREEDGKIFGRIYDHLRAGNTSKAREKSKELAGLAALKEREEQTDANAHEFCDKLAKELADVKKSLGKIAEYESFGSVDEKSSERYRGIMKRLEEYGDWRAKHIASLKEMPLRSLVSDMKLTEIGFPVPTDGKELAEFMKSEPELTEKSAEALIEMDSYRDEKLAHIVPQVSKFRRLVRENSKYLWEIRDLQISEFLSANSKETKHVYEYATKHGAPSAEVINELAELGEGGLEKLQREQERLEKRDALLQLAKPSEKDTLLARKKELESVLALFGK